MGRLFKKTGKSRERCCCIVAAAGASSRMEGVDKLRAEVCGIPVLARTLTALDACKAVDELVLVVRGDQLESAAELGREYGIKKLISVVPGGETRAESVYRGACAAGGDVGIIAVHDGARPFVTEETVTAAIRAAEKYNAAAAAIPVTSTIKTVGSGGVVTGTPDRAALREVQTPQCFRAELIKGALKYCLDNKISVTDDCMAVEALGAAVYLTQGSPDNIKITTPSDLAVAEAIVKMREAAK